MKWYMPVSALQTVAQFGGSIVVAVGLLFVGTVALADRSGQDDVADREHAKDLQYWLQQDHIDLDRIGVALKLGADPNAPNRNGIFPLEVAARSGSLALVRTLLKAGAHPDKRGARGYPGILVAASTNLPILRLLYENGGDLHARERYADLHGKTRYGDSLLTTAAASGSLAVCRFLVEHGLNVNTKSSNGDTALGSAAAADHVAVVRYLIHSGADPTVCRSCAPYSDCGVAVDRPLNVIETAAAECSNKVLAYLLKSDRFNRQRNAINRALFLALHLRYVEGGVGRPKRYGMADTVAVLLERGADVKMRNRSGDTPLLYGIRHIGPDESVKALVYLPVYYVLLKAGADINAQNSDGQTVLMAGAAGANSLYGFLLYHGADPNRRDKMGRTALMYNAAERDEWEQLAFDRIAAVHRLLEYGADLSMRDKLGKTAFDIATSTASDTVPADTFAPRTQLPADGAQK